MRRRHMTLAMVLMAILATGLTTAAATETADAAELGCQHPTSEHVLLTRYPGWRYARSTVDGNLTGPDHCHPSRTWATLVRVWVCSDSAHQYCYRYDGKWGFGKRLVRSSTWYPCLDGWEVYRRTLSYWKVDGGPWKKAGQSDVGWFTMDSC